MKYIALEGVAFAGKTTLINFLKENYNDQVVVIPEASEFIGGDKNFPAMPFASFEDAKASTHFFIEVEKQRCTVAIQKSHETGLPILFDRSTPLSSVLFYSLLKNKFPELHNFQGDFHQHALEIFQKELDNNTFFIPSSTVYLKPKNKTVFLNRLGRGTKNNVFTHWSSVEFQDKEYMQIIQTQFIANHLILETENTQENLESCAKNLLKFIQLDVASNSIPNFFSNFKGFNLPSIYNPNSTKEKQGFSKTIEHVKKLIKDTKDEI